MKVIGVGFGRTGTLSLRTALVALGFGPCHHMIDVTEKPELQTRWLDKITGKDIDWSEVLHGYSSIVDWPGCFYWEELLRRFPHAKAVLTVRNAETWYDSVAETIYTVAQAYNSLASASSIEVSRIIWNQTFHGRFADKEYAMSVFVDHNRRLIDTVARDRLLVYEVKTGWKPLCDFLGVDRPAHIDFPHCNDRVRFRGAFGTGPPIDAGGWPHR